ncbi:MAG: hypothetical protein ACRYFS_03605 [Janthinobacterium lividum]
MSKSQAPSEESVTLTAAEFQALCLLANFCAEALREMDEPERLFMAEVAAARATDHLRQWDYHAAYGWCARRRRRTD